MSIGERITELRKQCNMSQGELAQSVNVTRQAVSKWENDLANPDTIRLIQLADVLDTDIEYLATGRRMVYRRPPVVIKSVETIEKPVIQYVEKIVEKVVESPNIKYIEKPVIKEVPVVKRIIRVKYKRNWNEYGIVGVVCLIFGILIGLIF